MISPSGVDFERDFNLFRETRKGGYIRRFWSDVNITPFCWTWMRNSSNKGGPRFQIDLKDYKIARAAFYVMHGVWPKFTAFRTCSNSYCVRPKHVIDVPQKDIPALMSKLGRLKDIRQEPRKRCRRGHRMSGYNVYTHSQGRSCRTCLNAGHRARHARLRAAGVTGKI